MRSQSNIWVGMGNMDLRFWNGTMISSFFKVFWNPTNYLVYFIKILFSKFLSFFVAQPFYIHILLGNFGISRNLTVSIENFFYENYYYEFKGVYDSLLWKSRCILNSLYCWVLYGFWTMVEILMEVVMNFVYTQLIFFKAIE